MNLSASLLITNLLLLARASPQLLPPFELPTIAANFRLVAHVDGFPQKDLSPSIENWEVVSSSATACDGYAVLTGGISSGLSFYWDPATISVQSELGSHPLGLLIGQDDHGEPIKLSCGQGSSGVGIWPEGDGPQLAHRQGGQIYACEAQLSGAPVVQLFHRSKDTTALPASCVDVVLYAECADGPDHGDESLTVCCFDVMDGECRVSL